MCVFVVQDVNVCVLPWLLPVTRYFPSVECFSTFEGSFRTAGEVLRGPRDCGRVKIA